MAFFNWSLTAASNATADPTVNYSEGQAPSSLNDSARAAMARLREWGNDISGKITSAGTSTAYTVTTAQAFDSLAHLDGQMLCFIAHTTNGATVTLNCDGQGAKPLRSAPGVELPSGVMVQGTPYVVTYVSADSAFYLQGFTVNPYVIPIGGLMDFTGDTAPNSSFILPAGQAISRTTYATYFNMSGIGTRYGTGDGSSTFNVPDLRGRVVAALDNLNGSAASRITVAGGNFDGTVLGGTGGAQNHTLTTAEIPVHNHGVTDPGHTHTVTADDNAGIGASSTAGGGAPFAAFSTTTPAHSITSSSVTTGISINNAGSGSAHTILQPTMTLTKLLRII